MVYNFRAWLKAQFPNLPLLTNGFQSGTADEAVELNEGAGDDRPFFDRQDSIVQFLSRAATKPKARQNAIELYNYVRKRYGGCVFPEVTVDSVVYPEVTAWAIRPVNKPQYVGDTDNGNHLFSFSVDITTTMTNLQ